MSAHADAAFLYARRCHLRDLWKDARTLYGHATLESMTDEIRAASDPRLEPEDARYRGRLPIEHGAPSAWPFGETPKRLDDVARAFGVTRERARQIEAGALMKLRRNKLLRELREGVAAPRRWTAEHEAALQRAPRMAFVKGELERLRGVMRARGENLASVDEQAEVTRQIRSLFREWMNEGGADGQ